MILVTKKMARVTFAFVEHLVPGCSIRFCLVSLCEGAGKIVLLRELQQLRTFTQLIEPCSLIPK
jgi:hypothetical protein